MVNRAPTRFAVCLLMLVTLPLFGFATRAGSDAPVADAAMAGDLERVAQLVEEGADVNVPQGDGMTALHWAARRGHTELADFLLRVGADPGAATRVGAYQPLHLAAEVGAAEVVEKLLAAGAKQEPVSDDVGGSTPLHFAASAGSAASIRLLAEAGASPDVRESRWGQTPLIFAASRGRAKAVKALLDAGADPTLSSWVTDVAAVARWAVADRRGPRGAPPRECGAPDSRTSAAPGCH